jgi:hypothetical protein
MAVAPVAVAPASATSITVHIGPRHHYYRHYYRPHYYHHAYWHSYRSCYCRHHARVCRTVRRYY